MLINEELVLEYLSLVKTIAYKFKEKSGSNYYEVDDLIGYGTLGLINAGKTFDSSKNVDFRTYAWNKIYFGIIDGLRTNGMKVRYNRTKDEDGCYVYNTPRGFNDIFKTEQDVENYFHDTEWEKPYLETEEMLDYRPLYDALNLLPKRDKDIIEMYFFKNITLKQIGKRYKFGESRACQKVKAILKKLKENYGVQLQKIREAG